MIAESYVYTEGEMIIVQAFLDLPNEEKNHNYWNNPEINTIRLNIKSHYIQQQGYRCCYCNILNPALHGRVWDAEHIVPKSTHLRFMFETLNLAASCVECNVAKLDKNVLINKGVINYPTLTQRFRILHPHLDLYEAHIDQLDNIYVPRSEKGAFTIAECDLMRFARRAGGLPDHMRERKYSNMVKSVLSGDQAEADAAIHDANILIEAAKSE